MNAACIACMIKRQEEGIAEINDEAKKLEYMNGVLRIILEAGSSSAPVITERISELRRSIFGEDKHFEHLKRSYNQLMLEYEPKIQEVIDRSDDAVLTALKFARIGNYIDFGAMGEVDDRKLAELIEKAEHDEVDAAEFTALMKDLESAARLVYLTDNCGEIVADKLLVQALQCEFPQLKIKVIVRGKNVLNDATLEDAAEVGLTEIAEVIGNGTGVAGTDIETISKEAKSLIDEADVIISKGQGNFESLYGCGLNIYYLFLCKCDWFVRRFGFERYKAVIVNEKNLSMR